MKLIRAKLKSEADLAAIPRTSCCPKYLEAIKADEGYLVILDLDDLVEDPIACVYCYKYLGILKGARCMTGKWAGCLAPLDLFDLDEGGVMECTQPPAEA